MKSGRFHGKDLYICIGFAEKYSKIHYSWNPADFMVKFSRFHEIWRISWWNSADFMKSGGFHGEIWQISWNPVDFMVKFGRFHEIHQISCQGLWFWWKIHSVVDHTVYLCWFWRIKQKNPVFMKSGGFHGEIWQISWNQANFMKSGGFHPWNQVDFMADLEKCKLFL